MSFNHGQYYTQAPQVNNQQRSPSNGNRSSAAHTLPVNNDSTYRYDPDNSSNPAGYWSYQHDQRRSLLNPSSSDLSTHLSQYHYQSSTTPNYQQSNNGAEHQWRQPHSYQLPQTQQQQNPNYQPVAPVTTSNANVTQFPRSDSSSYQRHYATAHTNYRNGQDPSIPITVDPTVVYDASHEYRRQAAMAEAAKQAEKLENERKAAEKPKPQGDRQQENGGQVLRNQAVSDKSTPKSKKRPSSSKANSMPNAEQMQAATAMTLLQETGNATGKAQLEAQMRELFKKMREFNEQDPDMLCRLWTEERDDYQNRVVPTEKSVSKPIQSAQGPQTSKSRAPRKNRPESREKRNPQNRRKNEQAINGDVATGAAAGTEPASCPATVPTPGQVDLDAPATIPPTMDMAPTAGGLGSSTNSVSIASAVNEILRQQFDGKTIPATEIMRWLSGNPSYLEFCQILEARGFQLDRRKFAKDIMAAVPSFRARSQTANNAAQNRPEAPASEQLATFSDSPVSNDTNREKHSSKELKISCEAGSPETQKSGGLTSTSSNIDPALEGLDAVKKFVESTSNDPTQTHTNSQTHVSKPTNDRKSGKGQSRTLTTPLPPTKHDLARKRNFGDLVDLTRLEESDEDELTLPQGPLTKLSETNQLPTPPQTSIIGEKSPASGHSAADVVKPTSGSLTASLDSNIASSLPNRLPLLAAEHPVFSETMIFPLDKYKAIRRSSYDPRTIARDVLLASGRHPHMRHLNAHLESLKDKFNVDNNSDLNTFRWDLADPGGPAAGSNTRSTENIDSIVPDAVDADDEISDEESIVGRSAITTGGQAVNLNSRSVTDQRSMRGRSRVYKQKFAGFRHHAQSSDNTPSQAPSEPSRGPNEISSYRELREQQEQEARSRGEQVVRRRGRPVGWRKHMMKTPGSYKITSARTKQDKPSPEPVYEVYKCEWYACGAELHNLATLRKHVFKIHGKPDKEGKFVCRWSLCGRVKTINDPSTNRTTSKFELEEFSSLEAWSDHVEQKHFRPIAWQLGDGPKGGLSDNYESEVSESYNSDSQGRRVTPKVVVPSEASSANSRELQFKGMGQLQREAEMEKLAERNRKRDIGPAVDRQGATLATEKRRQGFIDNQDAMEIVDEED